jgi:hypothetical protein
MNNDRVSHWLTLAANVGVLAGLILVAVQINQNTQITKAQLANDYFLADMQLELAMMGEDPASSWIKAVYTPDELTREDAAIVDRYFNYGMVQILRLQKMYELGLGGDDWSNRIAYLDWHLGNEVGRRWWSYSKAGFPEDFVQMVEKTLERSDHVGNQELLDALMSEAGTE